MQQIMNKGVSDFMNGQRIKLAMQDPIFVDKLFFTDESTL